MDIPRLIDSATSIPAAFLAIANALPESTLYQQPYIDPVTDDLKRPRSWHATSYAESLERILKTANYLLSIGVGPGVNVAIISNTRPEWMEADIAVLLAGGSVASVYQTLPVADVAYILYDSEAQVVFAENREQVDKLLEVTSRPVEIPKTEDSAATTAEITLKKIISFDEISGYPLVISLKEILASSSAEVPAVLEKLRREDIASYVYTSGTTGPPKGVIQSHGNHLANVRQAVTCGMVQQDSSIMLFLPLAHSFARLLGYLGFLTPASLKFPGILSRESSKLVPESITKDIREGNAQIVPVVPRLLEKMQAGIIAEKDKPGLKGKLIKCTLEVSHKHYEAQKSGQGLGVKDQILYAGTAGIRKKIKHQLFGPNFGYSLSGGAKLAVSVAEFFDALGIEVCEGYGLTETCVATNVNRPGQRKIGTVGPVIAGDVELKFSDDGEITFRGPNIALGYRNRPTATKVSWDKDGWFHTGDLGSLDEDGFLTIEGRKKEIIVTSAGKNITPTRVEEKLKSSPYISQAVLFGDGKPHCVSLVTLDNAMVRAWAKKQSIELTEAPDENEAVRELVRAEIERINSDMPRFEQVFNFEIIPEEFTVDNGLLTPTFKTKRREIEKRYSDVIARL